MNSVNSLATAITLSDMEKRINAAHLHGWTNDDLQLANAFETGGMSVREWMDAVKSNPDIMILEEDPHHMDGYGIDSVAELYSDYINEQFRRIFNGDGGPENSPFIRAQSCLNQEAV